MLFTIQNFTQGSLHFPGGILMPFLGVYNSTEGIQISFQGVYNSTGGIQISFLRVYSSTAEEFSYPSKGFIIPPVEL